MTPVPQKISGKHELVTIINRIIDCLRGLQLVDSHNARAIHYSHGQTVEYIEGIQTEEAESSAIPEYDATETYRINDLVSYGSNRMNAANQLTMLQSGDGPGPGIYQALQTTTGNAPTGASSDTNWAQIIGFPLRCLSLKAASGSGKIVLDTSTYAGLIEVVAVPTCEDVAGVLTTGYRWIPASVFIAGSPPS